MESNHSIFILDAFVRFSGITLLLLLAFSLRTNPRSSRSTLYLFLCCISLIGLFIGLAPSHMQVPKILYVTSRLVDVPHLILVWLFSLSLFYRDFKLTLIHIVVAILYCLPILAVRLAQFGVFDEIRDWWVFTADIFSLMLMTHLILVAIKGRADDLSEKSRYSRVCFVIAISTIAILTAISEVWVVGTNREYIGTVKTAIIFPGIVWICFWLLRFSHRALDFEPKVNVDRNLSHKDKALLSDLEEAMTVKKLYLKPSY